MPAVLHFGPAAGLRLAAAGLHLAAAGLRLVAASLHLAAAGPHLAAAGAAAVGPAAMHVVGPAAMHAVFADVTIVHLAVVLVAGLAAGATVGIALRRRRSQPARAIGRILLPFTGESISRRALDAAIRLARAEDATLVPAYLAAVPLRLTLEAPLTTQCTGALPLLDAIEQRAQRYDIAVDSRIERGRSPRDGLKRLLAEEQFDRIVVPAASDGEAGFSADDVAWILEHVQTEVVVFRGAATDADTLSAAATA